MWIPGPLLPTSAWAAGAKALGCSLVGAGGPAPTSGSSGHERAIVRAACAVVPATHLAHIWHLLGVHLAVTAKRLCQGEWQVRQAGVSLRGSPTDAHSSEALTDGPTFRASDVHSGSKLK